MANFCTIKKEQKTDFAKSINQILAKHGINYELLLDSAPELVVGEITELIKRKAYRDLYLSELNDILTKAKGGSPEEGFPLIASIKQNLADTKDEVGYCHFEKLDCKDGIWKIYLGYVSSLNRMQRKFNEIILESSFVDRRKGVYVEDDAELNQNIRAFKISLFNNVIKFINEQAAKLGYEPLEFISDENSRIPASGLIDPDYYEYVMNYHNILGNFVESVMSKSVSLYGGNIDQQTEQEKIFNDLFILNNFDSLLSLAFNKIIDIDKVQHGLLDNTVDKYKLGLKGVQNMLWGAENLEAKSVKNSISNVAKVLMSTIHRLDINGKVIPGQYLSASDLSMMADVLKKLEAKYLYQHPEKKVTFLDNPDNALHTLIEFAAEIKDKKSLKVLLPLKVYLYDGIKKQSGDGYVEYPIRLILQNSISDRFSDSLSNNIADIPNVEALFAYELLKTAPVIYTSYTNGGAVKKTDVAGSYFAPNKIRDSLINGVTSIVLNPELFDTFHSDSDGNPIYRYYIGSEGLVTYTLSNLDKISQESVKAALSSQRLGRDFELLFGVPLSTELLQMFYDAEGTERSSSAVNGRITLGKILKFMQNVSIIISNINSEKNKSKLDKQTQVEKAIDNLLKSPDQQKTYFDIVEHVIMVSGQKPMTTITTVSGNSVPVYRLSSTGFEDAHYVARYKEYSHGQDDNILVDMPFLLSDDNGDGSKNVKYTTSTAIRLEAYRTEDQSKNEGGSELKTVEGFRASFFGDFVQMMMNENTFATQIMTYSDKVSVILKLFNATAEFDSILERPDSHINLKNISIQDLEYLYAERLNKYYQHIAESIFEDWNEFFRGFYQLYKPMDSNGMPITFNEITTWTQLQNQFNLFDKFAQSLGKKSYDVVQDVLHRWPEHIELTIDKHYCLIKNGEGRTILHVNNNLRQKCFEFESDEDFKAFQRRYELEFLKKTEIYGISDLLKHFPQGISLDSACKQLLSLSDFDRVQLDDKFRGGALVNDEGELHPLVRKYLLLTNMFKDAYLGITVKQPYIHKIKKYKHTEEIDRLFAEIDSETDDDVISQKRQLIAEKIQDDDDERVKAAMKRMVILPATKEVYAQKLLNGVCEDYNIAIIEDDKLDTQNFKGEIHDQDIYDGSAIGNPFMSILEENSLIAKGIRGSKKPIGMYSGEGFACLFKYAQFPITNRKILDSERAHNSLMNLMRKMNSIKFVDEKGYYIDANGQRLVDVDDKFVLADLSVNFTGKGLRSYLMNGRKEIYYQSGSNYYRIDNIRHVKDADGNNSKNNKYVIYRSIVDANGNVIDDGTSHDITVDIETIFDLWQVFGGCYSMELKDGKLDFSEDSIHIVSNYMNHVGFVQQSNMSVKDTLAAIASGKLTPKLGLIKLPLKDAMIHMVACASAVKNGGTNINGRNAWHSQYKSTDPTTGLLFFRIKTAGFGSQMDANHEADDAEVTEMSQVITSLAANGISTKEAKDAYEAIAKIIRDSIKEITDNIIKIEDGQLDQVSKQITKDLIKQMKDDDHISVSQAISIVLKDVGIVPFNNPNFYGLLTSSIISNLTNHSIRRKYSGLTTILHPSARMMQIFDINGKTLLYSDAFRHGTQLIHSGLFENENVKKLDAEGIVDLYLAWLKVGDDIKQIIDSIDATSGLHLGPKKLIKTLKNTILSEDLSSKDLDLYDTFVDSLTGEEKYIGSVEDLFDLHINERPVKKLLYKSRDLKSVSVTWNQNGHSNNAYTMFSSHMSYLLENHLSKSRRNLTEIELDLLMHVIGRFLKPIPGELGDYSVEQLLDDIFIKKDSNGIRKAKKILSRLRQRLFELLELGYNFKELNFSAIGSYNLDEVIPDFLINLEDEIDEDFLNGEESINDAFGPIANVKRLMFFDKVENKRISEAEIIMPKVNNSKYRLLNVSQCAVTKQHFLNFVNSNIDSDPDAQILISCNTHTYGIVLDDGTLDFSKYGNLARLSLDGVRYGNDNKPLYRVPKNVYAYEKKLGNGKVLTTFIVKTDSDMKRNISAIVDSIKDKLYVSIHSNYDKFIPSSDMSLQLQESGSKILDELMKICVRYNTIPSVRNFYKVRSENGLYTSLFKFNEYIVNDLADALYSSYEMTNHVISARVPSQALQSFMSMKVVALTDDDANNAYVSIWQPWLQGSDFDIDKAFNLMYTTSESGFYEGWSPLFDYSSKELLLFSEMLPTPNSDRTVNVENSKVLIVEQRTNPDSLSDISYLVRSYIKSSLLLQSNPENEELKKIRLQSIALILSKINDSEDGTRLTYSIISEDYVSSEEAMSVYSTFVGKLIDDINDHQTYNYGEDAARNIVTSDVRKTINNLKNMDSAYSPIDMSCVTDPMKEIEFNTGHKNLYDGFTVSEITEENSTGKATVGVMANGVKAFFTITQYLNKYYKGRTVFNPSDPQMFSKDITLSFGVNSNEPAKTYHFKTISDTKLKAAQKRALFEALESQLSEDKRIEFENSVWPDDDASLVISAFVSLATDNAKELALAKLNAGLQLASIHIYLTMMGVDPETLVKYTTTPLFNAMSDLMAPDMLTDADGFRNLAEPDFASLQFIAINYENPEWTLEDVNELAKIYYASKEVKDLTSVLGINLGLTAKTDSLFMLKNKLNRAWKSMQEDNIDFIEPPVYKLDSNGQLIPNGNGSYKIDYSKTPMKKPLSTIRHISLEELIDPNFERFKHIRLVCKEALRQKLNQKMHEHPEYEQYLELDIDFNKFFEDEDYREFIIQVYDLYKHTFNVYDIIASSENFGEMLNAALLATKELASVSTKFDFQFNLAEKLYEKAYDMLKSIGYSITIERADGESVEIHHQMKEFGMMPYHIEEDPSSNREAVDNRRTFYRYPSDFYVLNRKLTYVANWKLPKWDAKMAAKAGKYWDEMVTRKFLSSDAFEQGGKFEINPTKICDWFNVTFGASITPLQVYADTSTLIGKLKFIKEFVELYLLRGYQNKFPTNEFLRSITLKLDKSDSVRKLLFKESLNNLSSDEEINRRETILQDFDFLSGQVMQFDENSSMTIGDMLYLYNLVVNKDKIGQYALTAMFSNYLMKNEDSIGRYFIQFQLNTDRDQFFNEQDPVNFLLYVLSNRLLLKDKDTGLVNGHIILYTKDDKEHFVKDPLFISDTPASYNLQRVVDIQKIINLIKNGDLKIRIECE